MKGYAICTTPRSGSNFLGQLLESTGVLGRPLEYFNAKGRRTIGRDPDYPTAPQKQIERILRSATPNGVYGLKVFPYQNDRVSRKVRWSEALPGLHFVFLERRDLLGQAISFWRAKRTSQHRASQPALASAEYRAEGIARCLKAVVSEQARWALFFARNGVTPLHLTYEDVVDQPAAAVEAVAKLIALDEPARIDLTRVDLIVQRDTLNEEWRTRFLIERRNLDVVDSLLRTCASA